MTPLPRARRFPFVLALLVVPVLSAPAWAHEARNELLRLVPDDMALCLAVTNLRGQAARLAAAPWMKPLLQSPLVKALAGSPEIQQANKLNDVLRQKLDVTLTQLGEEVFGDAVVLAYRFGPPGKHDRDQGLVLLRARNGALLARLVDRINKDQQQSGEIKELQPRDYRGLRYYYRKKDREEQFYFLSGPFLAVAGREELLKEVLDHRLAPTDGRQESRAARGLRGTDAALAGLWLNPRAFDGALQAKMTVSTGSEARVLQTFRGWWQALEDVTLALAVTPAPELRLTVRLRPETLSPAFRRLLDVSAHPSELWGRFPKDALLTVAGRTDFVAQDQLLGEFQTPAEREASRQGLQRTLGAALGMDLFTDVLPRLGPDWGCCVAEAPGGAGFPHALIALRIQAGPEDAPVDQAIFRALQVFAGLAVAGHNGTHKAPIRLKGLKQGPVEVKYLTGDGAFPAGVEPAFALKDGYLVLASAPAAVERFGPAPAAVPTVAEVRLFRVSVRRLARVLQNNREAVVRFLAGKNHVAPEAAEHWLDNLLPALRLADHLEVNQRSGPGQVSWTLRLHLPVAAP